MGKVIEHYCNYCNKFKVDPGFRLRFNSSSTPQRMCSSCQEIRTRSRRELEDLAVKEKQERKQR